MPRRLRFLLPALVAGCTFAADPSTPSWQGPPPSAEGTTTTEPDASTSEPSTSSDATGAGTTGAPLPRFDVGAAPPDVGPAAGGPCPGVDVLFVIDDSYSMADEQQNLIASFPAFSDGLLTLVGTGYDVHVGVVTTDDYAFNEDGCTQIGALTTKTGGKEASNQMCAPFVKGRFMTGYDDLVEDFACTARVGISGASKERPILAALEALAPEQQAPGACNAGFRRDDALFVLVVVTDEDDLQDTPGLPSDWYETLVERAGGEAERIVVLSLVGTEKPNACPGFQWNGADGAQIATQIIAFTEMFGDRGYVGDVCAPDYGPFFDEALSVVASACAALPAG